MQKSPTIKIHSDNLYKHDSLSRQKSIENISGLLQNFTSPMTMSITAPWGQGKTTFVKMLEAELNNKNCTSVYFSAWETDFAVDPLVAFLGEMNDALELRIRDNVEKNELLEKTKETTALIARKAIPSIIKTVTLGIIDASEEIEELVGSLVGDASKNIVDEYARSKSDIKEFRNNIRRILTNEDGDVEKIYIFVDELDRCRPTYAIELLERIKHLLNIEGLVFILTIDKEQLIASIRGFYGANFNAQEYLKRFIDIEYKLPKTSVKMFIESQVKYHELQSFFEGRKTNPNFEFDLDHLINIFIIFTDIKRLTLRDIEQYFAKLSLIIKATANSDFLTPILTIYLLILKDYHPKSYLLYSNPESSVELLVQKFYETTADFRKNAAYTYSLLEAQIVLSKEKTQKKEVKRIFSENRKALEDYEPGTIDHDHFNVIHIFMARHQGRYKIDLETIISRIEMLSQFNFDN